MNYPIEVDNARFSYGDKPIFDAVSFSIGEGEFAGIIGSNGTGKSTLLKLLLGELTPESGSVRLLGENLRRFRNWPRIGYVPQHGLAALGGFPATAGEIVLSGVYRYVGPLRFIRRQHRKRAREALERVGMQDSVNELIGNLSGGQQQRVLLARVLAGQPEVMLLDEPLTGIDSRSAEQIYRLLDTLSHEQGLTILMVTHDISRAEGYLDRIFCLEDETLVEVAHEQIQHELQHRHRHPPHDGVRPTPSESSEHPHSIPALAPSCGWPDPTRSGKEVSDGNL